MENDALLTSNKRDRNIPAYSYMKMMQRQAPSSNYIVDDLASCIPTNNHSKLITTQKPRKIRIIHVMPPEVIQTDKANFRNLVQSLTGRSSSAPNTITKQHQRPQVSPSYHDLSYLLGFSDSSPTKFNPNKLFLDDPIYHEQLSLAAESDHDLLIGGFKAKVEKDEIMVRAAVDTDWEMQDIIERGFCIDGFLELDEWLPQETEFHSSVPYVGSNLGTDMFGEF